MPFLLDSNILLPIVRNERVWEHLKRQYFSTGLRGNAFISAVSIGEVRVIARRNKWGTQKTRRLLQILNQIRPFPILDKSIQDAYVNIDTYSQNNHKSLTLPSKYSARNMGKNDLWIAATATAKDLTLLSTDRDFEHLNDVFLSFTYINVEQILNKI